MFFDVIKELTRIKFNKSVYKQFGKKNYDNWIHYGIRDIDLKDRHLSTLKEIANKLDVPTEFIVSILKYEEIDEDDT